MRMLRDAKRRCLNKDLKHPTYSNIPFLLSDQEFLDFAIPAITDFLKNNPLAQPSIDRIDNRLPYQFGNLQIISWKDHKIKSAQERLVKLLRQN